MDKEELNSRLTRAIESLFKVDMHLLNVNSSERSITHRLAYHLTHEFSEYDVDCEYNRDGFDIKRLEINSQQTSSEEDEAVTVFPDIVVHKRGNNKSNLLVVELKKASSTKNSNHDIQKLKAFRKELHYTYAAHVIVSKNLARCLDSIHWEEG